MKSVASTNTKRMPTLAMSACALGAVVAPVAETMHTEVAQTENEVPAEIEAESKSHLAADQEEKLPRPFGGNTANSTVTKRIESCTKVLEMLSKNKEKGEKYAGLADALKENITRYQQYKRFLQFHQLHTEEDLAAAAAAPNTLIIPVRDQETGATFSQAITLDADKYTALTSWLLGLEDNSLICSFPLEKAEELIRLRSEQPQAYLSRLVVELANSFDSFHSWLFAQADKHHPLFNEDNTVKSEFLTDDWKVMWFKGAGEILYLAEDERYMPVVQDRWFFRKLEKASPADRRFMGAKFDMHREVSFFGRFMKWLSMMIRRYWDLVFAHTDDKNYHVPFAAEQPFEKPLFEFAPTVLEPLHGKFDMPVTLSQILGNVYTDATPRRPETRQFLLDLVSRASDLQPYLTAGNQPDEKKKGDQM